jgi:hypothetical protein
MFERCTLLLKIVQFVWKLTKKIQNENKQALFSAPGRFLQKIEATRISIDEKVQ